MPKVIVFPNCPNPPEPHELDAAWVLARHYDCIVEFLIPIDDYKRKTPDIVMCGKLWEIKSPTGASWKHTVQNQFTRATKQQVSSLVFDGRRTKLPDDFLMARIQKELSKRHRIKEVIFIGKQGKVIEFP